MQTQDAIKLLRTMLDEEERRLRNPPKTSEESVKRTEENEAKQRALLMVGLALLENFLDDLRRSADALETLAANSNQHELRERGG